MMMEGALVMMDALGFKGIWNRHPAETVISSLRRLRAIMRHSPFYQVQLLETIRVELLSDTVVIGVVGKPPCEVAVPVVGAAAVASILMREAAASVVPLAYRGCVSFGKFILEENFIVGPAVDEAAQMMDSAQGAFVWLTPSALRADAAEVKHYPLIAPLLVPYAVPLKGGDVFQTFAVSPFDNTAPESDRLAISRCIEDTFGTPNTLDVAIKKQRTQAFLAYARAAGVGTDVTTDSKRNP